MQALLLKNSCFSSFLTSSLKICSPFTQEQVKIIKLHRNYNERNLCYLSEFLGVSTFFFPNFQGVSQILLYGRPFIHPPCATVCIKTSITQDIYHSVCDKKIKSGPI